MAGVNNEEQPQPALHAKRKPDLSAEDDPSKKQKVENTDNNASPPEHKVNTDEAGLVPAEDNEEADEEDYEDEDDEDDDDDDDDDEEEEEDGVEDGGEHSNGKKAEVDPKGKGILREDKGKGKLIEEDGSEDDSSDDASQSDVDSDLSDDPLAEVDLDNILPSRTRRRVVQPGVYLANNPGDDGDDSDDSDA